MSLDSIVSTVQDFFDQKTSTGPLNVSEKEREISVAAGVGAGLLALRHPLSFRSIVLGYVGYQLIRRGMSGHCALYESLGHSTASTDESPSAAPGEYNARSIHVEATTTIMKPPAELYAFWKNLENLPKFMEHIKEVKPVDEKKSHWTARGPLGFNIDWTAEIINDVPNELIAWQSVGEAEMDSAGSVKFTPFAEGAGTQLRVVMDYIPPAGRVGHYLTKLFGGDASSQMVADLRQLKRMLEAGESPTNADGEPRGVANPR